MCCFLGVSAQQVHRFKGRRMRAGLCAENGIEAELVPCNLMEGAHKTPEFLKMNPMHCIPTMVS